MSRDIHEIFIHHGYEIDYDNDNTLYVKKIFDDFTFRVYGTIYYHTFDQRSTISSYKIFSICCEYKYGSTLSIIVNRSVRNLLLLLKKMEKIAILPYDNIYNELLSLM